MNRDEYCENMTRGVRHECRQRAKAEAGPLLWGFVLVAAIGLVLGLAIFAPALLEVLW